MSDLNLWLPDGRGTVDIRVWRCMNAAREYDARLTIGQDQTDGQWAVYIKLERGTLPEMDDLFPIFGLGRDPEEFPHPEDLKKRLYESDTVRQGDELLDKLNRENERLKKEQAYEADEASGIAAEALAWGTSQMTNDISKRRISVAMNETAERRHMRTR